MNWIELSDREPEYEDMPFLTHKEYWELWNDMDWFCELSEKERLSYERWMPLAGETYFTQPQPELIDKKAEELAVEYDAWCFESECRDLTVQDNFIAGFKQAVLRYHPRIKELEGLLKIAKCPLCDGSGAYMDGGEPIQCQWCDEREQALTNKKGE